MISEKTLIPISLVVMIGGFIFWAASLDQQVKHHTVALNSMPLTLESMREKQDKVTESVFQMRGDIEVIKKMLEKK